MNNGYFLPLGKHVIWVCVTLNTPNCVYIVSPAQCFPLFISSDGGSWPAAAAAAAANPHGHQLGSCQLPGALTGKSFKQKHQEVRGGVVSKQFDTHIINVKSPS